MSAKFESKLAVTAPMWEAERNTQILVNLPPLTFQRAPVAIDTWIAIHTASGRRCEQRTSMRGKRFLYHEADEQLVQQDSVPDEEITFPVQRNPALPHCEHLSSWPVRCEVTRWVVYLGSLSNNTLCPRIGFFPRKVLLVGAGRSAVWPARRLSQCSWRH
jgi:hypothetical protein